MQRTLRVILLAALLLVPTAAADEISGHSTVIHVGDQNKHTAPTESDVTFLDYQFDFGGSAPNPATGNPADAVGYAWLLLAVDHQYHNGQTVTRDAVEDNVVSYKITFNGLVIQYDTTLHVEDSGWDIGKLFSSLNPFSGGDHGFGKRGFVSLHFLVYNESAALVADETLNQPIYSLTPGSIPDSLLWFDYSNQTLTITPDFLDSTVLPRYFSDAPKTAVGQVKIANQTYQSLEIQITATKALEDVSLAYGFGRPGTIPGYTLGSLLSDAATSVGQLLGGAVNAIVDFVFKFIPHGDKILYAKDFITTLIGAFWEVWIQDPLVTLEDFFLLALMYGILLFIDPMFKHVFTPLFFALKCVWKILVGIWIVFLWIVRFIVSKIPTGGG